MTKRQKGKPFGDISGSLKRFGEFDTIAALDGPSPRVIPPSRMLRRKGCAWGSNGWWR